MALAGMFLADSQSLIEMRIRRILYLCVQAQQSLPLTTAMLLLRPLAVRDFSLEPIIEGPCRKQEKETREW